ncbi:Iron(III)-hydroxamate-binding protein fhuD [Raoultella terrigena]|uniref:Iron(III)-hydroxamate-binding protein fhuD n=1 Tax=Raoultella terrigena TaxID=577 RepID=A0A485B0Q6_RAOTE|nr:Iron(III)-hydroxamate-binding protein fhuD [Raoultella terrigena]
MEKNNVITRRRLLTAMALSPLLWQMRGARAATVDPQRIVALEWLPVELLLALGVVPYGVADIPNYRLWVNEPALPDSVIDVGLRTEPNLELLTQMNPSYIVWSAGYGPVVREAGAYCAGARIYLQRRQAAADDGAAVAQRDGRAYRQAAGREASSGRIRPR